MDIIAAIDQNGGLGYQGRLLCAIPEDMRRFRRLTWGHTLICGRATLAALPGGLPLAGRRTLLLSHGPGPETEGLSTAHSLPELLAMADCEPEPVFVIGGASVYRQLLPWCSRAYMTLLETTFRADCWFPQLSEAGWLLAERSASRYYQDIPYRFLTYENPAPREINSCVNRI